MRNSGSFTLSSVSGERGARSERTSSCSFALFAPPLLPSPRHTYQTRARGEREGNERSSPLACARSAKSAARPARSRPLLLLLLPLSPHPRSLAQLSAHLRTHQSLLHPSSHSFVPTAPTLAPAAHDARPLPRRTFSPHGPRLVAPRPRGLVELGAQGQEACCREQPGRPDRCAEFSLVVALPHLPHRPSP